MTSFVAIDAGVAFKLLAPNRDRDALKRLVRQWMAEGRTLCAPSLWLYEVASIFTKMVHWGELNEEDARASLALTSELDVQLIAPDGEQAQRAFAWARRLGRAAAYDSFYLAVAETLNCELWTTDRRLVNAVHQDWVKLAPPS